MIVEDADLPADSRAILSLNNPAVPAVNAIDEAELAAFARMGAVRIVRGDPVAGAIVLLPPKMPYDSANYAWFNARFDDFLYVDRVIVAAAARGSGVGRALYEDAIAQAARDGRARVCAEVNVEPPNPGSMAFHARLGFSVLAERDNPSAGKRVAMLERPI